MLRWLPANLRQRLIGAIEQVALDPFGNNPQAKRLKGASLFRLRVGDWRIIYAVERDRLAVVVAKIGARGDVCD